MAYFPPICLIEKFVQTYKDKVTKNLSISKHPICDDQSVDHQVVDHQSVNHQIIDHQFINHHVTNH